MEKDISDFGSRISDIKNRVIREIRAKKMNRDLGLMILGPSVFAYGYAGQEGPPGFAFSFRLRLGLRPTICQGKKGPRDLQNKFFGFLQPSA